MEYTKQGFQDGNILNASQLNAMDDELKSTSDQCDTVDASLVSHSANTVNHVTANERAAWNAKADGSDFLSVKRKTDALWKINDGVTFDFESDDDAGDKTVPTGAHAVSALSIGGVMHKFNQIAQPARLSVKSRRTNTDDPCVATSTDGFTYTIKGTHTYSDSGSVNEFIQLHASGIQGFEARNGHKLLLSCRTKNNQVGVVFCQNLPSETCVYLVRNIANIEQPSEKIVTSAWNASNPCWVRVQIPGANGAHIDDEFTFQAFDLTDMFGAGNEPSTVGEFRALFPREVTYPYSGNGIVTAPVESVRVCGRNLFRIGDDFSSVSHSGITVSKTALNSFRVTGSLEGSSQKLYAMKTLHLDAGTYYIKTDDSFVDTQPIQMQIRADDYDTIIVNCRNTNEKTSFTVTRSQDCKLYVHCTAGYTYDHEFSFMITRGSTEMPYSAYAEPTVDTIPSAVRALTGYGWGIGDVCNAIDYVNKRFVQRIGRVDMGTLNWGEYTADDGSVCYTVAYSDKASGTGIVVSEYMSIGSVANAAGFISSAADHDKCCGYGSSSKNIYFRDASCSSAAEFKAAVSGVMMYVVLDTPVWTDISSMLNDSSVIACEAGGTVEFVYANKDKYKLSVPNTVEYVVKLSEVNDDE